MKALITGGAGFIGSHLTAAWLQNGGQARVLDDFSLGQPANLDAARGFGTVDCVEGDVGDADLLRRCVDGATLFFTSRRSPACRAPLRHPCPVTPQI